jgi:hypothetical protein
VHLVRASALMFKVFAAVICRLMGVVGAGLPACSWLISYSRAGPKRPFKTVSLVIITTIEYLEKQPADFEVLSGHHRRECHTYLKL